MGIDVRKAGLPVAALTIRSPGVSRANEHNLAQARLKLFRWRPILCPRCGIDRLVRINGIPMQVLINGEARKLASAMTVESLLDQLGLDGRKVAVERNLEIVPTSAYGQTQLGVPQFNLIALQVEAFDPNQLPPDLAKIPAVKPGSK